MPDKQTIADAMHYVLALDVLFLTIFAASRVRAFFAAQKFPKEL